MTIYADESPAVTRVGVTLVMDGVMTGPTVNVSELEVPLVGSCTVIGNVPKVPTLFCDSCACTWFALSKTVLVSC